MIAARIVLYDGVCNLCDGAVRFILPRDAKGRFRFASLQSAFAQRLLAQSGIKEGEALQSILLFENGVLYSESTAMLRICAGLRFPWNLLAVFRLVPRPLRDGIYRWIARNRYRWFGKEETCLLPQPKWRDRFIDPPEL